MMKMQLMKKSCGALLACLMLLGLGMTGVQSTVQAATFTPTTFSDVAISSTGVVNASGQITNQGNAITLRSARTCKAG